MVRGDEEKRRFFFPLLFFFRLCFVVWHVVYGGLEASGLMLKSYSCCCWLVMVFRFWSSARNEPQTQHEQRKTKNETGIKSEITFSTYAAFSFISFAYSFCFLLFSLAFIRWLVCVSCFLRITKTIADLYTWTYTAFFFLCSQKSCCIHNFKRNL